MIVRGRWLLRPGRAAVENAGVAVREGLVGDAGPWARLAGRAGGEQVTDLGDVVLVPGFVNAHTHLRLSDLRGRFPPPAKFTDWLNSIIGVTRSADAASVAGAVRAGAAESLTAGVTALADVSYDGAGAGALAEFPLRATVFVEVYGHTRRQVADRLASAVAAAEAIARGPRLGAGLSPHAPYSAGPVACVAAAREADARGWPLTMHLHETRGELELYLSGKGEFKRWVPLRAILSLSRFKPTGRSPIQTLAEAGFFDRPVLVAHGNYLDDADIGILRRSRSTVVYCPRSHAYFGHADHPYRRLAAAGVPVALGTDSLASSPSLSVLDEMRFLHGRDFRLSGDALLTMATAAGADVLGDAGRAGRLAPGEEADFVAVRPAAACPADPYDAILDPAASVAGVWIRGTRVVV